MPHRQIQFVRDEQRMNRFGGSLDHSARLRQRSVIEGKLRANCIAQFRISKPRKIIVVSRNALRLRQVKIQRQSVGASTKIVLHRGEQSRRNQFVRCLLQVLTSNLRPNLQSRQRRNLRLRQLLLPVAPHLPQRRRPVPLRLRLA